MVLHAPPVRVRLGQVHAHAVQAIKQWQRSNIRP